jgi:hypothetical protein
MLLIFCSCLYSVLIKPTCLLSIIRNGLVFLITSFASFYFDLFRSICFYFLFFYTKSVISFQFWYYQLPSSCLLSLFLSLPVFRTYRLIRSLERADKSVYLKEVERENTFLCVEEPDLYLFLIALSLIE